MVGMGYINFLSKTGCLKELVAYRRACLLRDKTPWTRLGGQKSALHIQCHLANVSFEIDKVASNPLRKQIPHTSGPWTATPTPRVETDHT
eukprot:2277177-Amphidinium_carterae.1